MGTDLMFDLNFRINGLDYPVKYTYKDCIFVFEDVGGVTAGHSQVTDQCHRPSRSLHAFLDLDA